jgi:nucleoid-associated protein YgaU
MGLFDFVKEAGEKIFGKEEKTSAAAPAADQKVLDRRLANALARSVRDHGLEVEGLDVDVSDGVATVRGKVADQETREKVVLSCGNAQGIARVDDRLEVGSSSPEARFYTVVKGDTLSKIAKEHYGNAMKYPVIFEANKPMLKDPDKIYPGQVLRIPTVDD